MDKKLYSVQYLRALAAVLVVIAHAAAHPLSGQFYLLHRLGQVGVVVFFVISGFIMVAISGEGRFSPLEFLKRRAIRIVPLYWIFTSLAAFLALVLPMLFKSTVFTWPHYLQSLLFLPHEAPGRGGSSPLVSLGWTLNYEVYFYLAFAALAFLAATGRVAVLSIAFVGLAILGAVLQPADAFWGFYLNFAPLGFVAGAWVGLFAIKGGISTLPRIATPVVLLVGSMAFLVAFVFDQSVEESYAVLASNVILAVALLVLGLRFETAMPKHARLELLGDASYAIYLSHMFVVGAAVAIGFHVLPGTGTIAYLAVVSGAVVVSLVVGVAVHLIIEKPLLRMMRGPQRPATPQMAGSAA